MDLGMTVVGWLLFAIMFAGVFTIVISRLSLKLDDNGLIEMSSADRVRIEMLMQHYEEMDFAGRLNFVVVHGARIWATLLFGKTGG